ncbi:hypothetical protein ACFYUR_29535 [Micromonospora haikouensis]|uniref:hypothetical protein n=1 Tax=Micromonospora haikouensis TaxID=686309 RepID=UPI003409B187
MIAAYLAVLDRQSSLRGPSYGNSPWEDMVILGVYSAPVFLGTLLAGLFCSGVSWRETGSGRPWCSAPPPRRRRSCSWRWPR